MNINTFFFWKVSEIHFHEMNGNFIQQWLIFQCLLLIFRIYSILLSAWSLLLGKMFYLFSLTYTIIYLEIQVTSKNCHMLLSWTTAAANVNLLGFFFQMSVQWWLRFACFYVCAVFLKIYQLSFNLATFWTIFPCKIGRILMLDHINEKFKNLSAVTETMFWRLFS